MVAIGDKRETAVNGVALASFVAAGIGALAVGVFVILNEAGLFAAPALYGPAGGLSGRTTFAVVTWLVSWAVLHRRWKDRRLEAGRLYAITLLLITLGIVLCFPPVWSIFG
jgi:hypothetical protein